MQAHLEALFELLAIPSISAQSAHKVDIQKTAKWLSDKLRSLKFKSQILPTNGHPVVYAEHLLAKDAPTILIYGHYDVQSPDPLDEWTSDPFKPEIRSNNIYARGVADDKGQLYTWIAAVEELSKKGTLPVNIKFLIEGEEEVGSENLDNFVEGNTALLESDICVISDSHSLSTTQPLIDYGLRGLAYMELTLKTLGKDVHSGIYGGNVLNPANVLAEVISKLKDLETHKVLIPHFYDDVRVLSKDEKKQLEKLPFTDKEIKEETGARVVVGENEFGYHARAGARPTLDVNGMISGYTGEGPKTIIPSVAQAKISMRLVPHQNSKKIAELFEEYVETLLPKGVESEIRLISTGEPILMDTSSDYFKQAERAFKKVFGNTPVYALSGGSIPVTATFKRLLGIDSILMGYGLPDDGLHAPNEKLSVEMFEKGIKTNIAFFESFK